MENKEYFKKWIQWPAIFALLGMVILAVAYYELERWQDQLTQEAQAEKQKLDSLVGQVNFLRTQYQLYLTYGDRYQALIKEGLAKQQDRVKWTDMLLLERENLVINPMDIQFEAQKPIQKDRYTHLKIPSNIFYETTVNLRMGVQTDVDVFQLLADIDQKISRFYIVKSCQQSMMAEGLKAQVKSFDPFRPMIQASCRLVFFNSKPKPFVPLAPSEGRPQGRYHREPVQ